MTDKERNKITKQEIRKLTTVLGLSQIFWSDLDASDDWTFVIRLHATIESTLNWALTTVLQPHKLETHVLDLPIAGRTSKVTLGLQLRVMEKEDAKFISVLSKARNRVVHNIKHVGFNFASFLAELPQNERDQFVTDSMVYFDLTPQLRSSFLKIPRPWVKESAIRLLLLITLATRTVIAQKRTERLKLKTADLYTKQTKPKPA